MKNKDTKQHTSCDRCIYGGQVWMTIAIIFIFFTALMTAVMFVNVMRYDSDNDRFGMMYRDDFENIPYFNNGTSQNLNQVVTGTVDISDDRDITNGRLASSYIEYAQTETVYHNNQYGFQLTFPKSWGDIKEDSEPLAGPFVDVEKVLRLTSTNDADEFMSILIFPNDSIDLTLDTPMTLMAKNDQYHFYYQSSGDYYGRPGLTDQKYLEILNRCKAIATSLKLK